MSARVELNVDSQKLKKLKWSSSLFHTMFKSKYFFISENLGLGLINFSKKSDLITRLKELILRTVNNQMSKFL